jgi:hypothetical protein
LRKQSGLTRGLPIVVINDENKSLKRKRVETVPEKGKSRNKHMKVVTSSSSDNSSSSSSESDSDEIFDPGHSKVFDKKKKVPGHIVKYIEKYATKGITRKNRQSMSDCWPIPSSKKLKGLETDRFYKKYFLKGKKWNAKLERGKINTQLRILDVMGPLTFVDGGGSH